MGSMLPSKGMKRLLTFCINRLKTLITSVSVNLFDIIQNNHKDLIRMEECRTKR